MRNYKKTIIKIDCIEVKIQMWDEHNHGTVWNGETQIFDGYISGAWKAFDAEVKKTCEMAKMCGFNPEVII